eukprot:CAMPEP_0197029952 /NCGR_PEP_ID=MMETSP1384-20130603/9296_1 /TAXON_ID=29189 /ORGANISM="Ammonia sp." /LENGTH=418 /DNA_ID=CAMNT_0042459215 /DNA_START=57 /DNA_END=1313 /DNA_ORIENTATION=-
MNGADNPNANRMAGFGKGKNYMKAGNDKGGVNVADILPKDPYAQSNNDRTAKWIKESEEKHKQRQAQIAAEQEQFVPESFKKSGAMNLDIKGNKSQAAQKTWLDNNSKLGSGAKRPQQPQPEPQPQNNNNNNAFPYGNNNQPAANQPNNFPHNNNMPRNQNQNPNQNQKPNQRPPQQQKPANNNMNMQRNNNASNNNNKANMPQNPNQHKQPPPQMNNKQNNGNMQANPQQNNNNNSKNNNNFDLNAALNRPQGPVEQPIPQPYHQKKQDPFAQFVNNSQYQRDLKDHGGAANKGGYSQMNKPNYRPYNHNAQQSNHNQQQDESANLYHTGSKESKNWSGVDNQFSQPIRSVCTACGKAVQESWTEDSKQRIFHNECFACTLCGTPLGQVGKYVTVSNGVMCKPCRSQQMKQQHPDQY